MNYLPNCNRLPMENNFFYGLGFGGSAAWVRNKIAFKLCTRISRNVFFAL
jgi:hypothetical protein